MAEITPPPHVLWTALPVVQSHHGVTTTEERLCRTPHGSTLRAPCSAGGQHNQNHRRVNEVHNNGIHILRGHSWRFEQDEPAQTERQLV